MRYRYDASHPDSNRKREPPNEVPLRSDPLFQMSSASESLWARAQFAATAALLTAALLFGGGQGTLGDTGVQVLSIALLMLLIVRSQAGNLRRTPSWTWLPVLAVVAVPLLQCLPIPESIWRGLGGRAELATQLALAGVPPDPHWGLNPLGSERALLWLLPAIALYLSALRLSRQHRGQLVLVLLALAVIEVLFGFAQVADGRGSPLRFYANTNPTEAVGFFANRNHFAGLVALCLPLALAWAAKAVVERYDDHSRSVLRIVAGIGLCLLLILGLAMARSRAGLLLGMIALVLTVPVLLGLQRRRGLGRILFATFVVAAVLVVQFALFGILQRVGDDPLDDGRWAYAETTRRAAAAYAPVGSGLGTFRQAYQPFERDSPAGPTRSIVNHAHNDYLELWLETGWTMLPVMFVILGVLLLAAVRTWRATEGRADADTVQRRALVVAAAIPLLHSLFDYPLRTSAHLAVFGLIFALIVAASLPRRQA